MRRHRKQNLIVRIGKILLNIVLVGTAIVTTYVMADNGLFKNTWNNMTQQEQVQEEVQDETKDEIFGKLLLRVMESLAKSFNLDETRVYTHHSFNKYLQIKLKKYLKDEVETNKPCDQKEVELYKLLQLQDYNELRKQALLNPIDTLKAIYIYTICEA